MCSSCLGHVDPTLVLPSRFLGPTNARTTNNGFSTTAHLGEEGVDAGKGNDVAPAAEEGNGSEIPKLRPRQLRRRRDKDNRRLREKALLDKSNASTVAPAVKKARNTRSDISPKIGNLSDSAEALDALRKSMMDEDGIIFKTEDSSSKRKATASGSGTKKGKSAATVVDKTITLPGGAKKISKVVKIGKSNDLGKDTMVKEKKTASAKPSKKKIITTAETEEEVPLKRPLKVKRLSGVPSDPNLQNGQTDHVRKIYDGNSKYKSAKSADSEPPGIKITVSTYITFLHQIHTNIYQEN